MSTTASVTQTVKEEFAILKAKGRAGSSVKTAVIKATRNEMQAPKKKHVEYLIASTKGNKPNLTAMLKALRSRVSQKDWPVVLKTLAVEHRLLRDADPSFATACARTSVTAAQDFSDVKSESNTQQSAWIRIYSKYLEHKVKIIQKFEVQFEDMPEKLHEWDYDVLLVALKFMLVQLALLLEFEERLASLDNPITLQSFALLLRDSVGLYGALLQGFLRITEEFRELCRTEAEDAADLYDKFIDYSERLINSFYPKCGRYTKQLPQFDPAPEAMLKELDRYARDEAPEAPPPGRKARLLDRARQRPPPQRKGVREFDAREFEESRGSRRSSGAPSAAASAAPRARGEREQRRQRDKSGRQRASDDVSFEDIPKSWLQNPPVSGGAGSNRLSASGRARKEKGEYDYSDEARSDEVSRSSEEKSSRSSRGPPPSFSPKQMFDEQQRQLELQDQQQRALAAQQQQQMQQMQQQQLQMQQAQQLQMLQAQQQQLIREQQMREQQMREQQIREQQIREQQQQMLRQQVQAAPQSYDPFASTSNNNNSSGNFSNNNFSSANNNNSSFGVFAPSSNSNFSAVDGSFGNANASFGNSSLSAAAPPLSGGSSFVSPARSSTGGSVLYDPFALPVSSPAPAPVSAAASLSYDPFSPSRLSGTPSASLTPAAAGSPFFQSVASPASVPQARLFPASPFDPSLPAVGKSAEVGPNVLDARQFDPFQVVNL